MPPKIDVKARALKSCATIAIESIVYGSFSWQQVKRACYSTKEVTLWKLEDDLEKKTRKRKRETFKIVLENKIRRKIKINTQAERIGL